MSQFADSVPSVAKALYNRTSRQYTVGKTRGFLCTQLRARMPARAGKSATEAGRAGKGRNRWEENGDGGRWIGPGFVAPACAISYLPSQT